MAPSSLNFPELSTLHSHFIVGLLVQGRRKLEKGIHDSQEWYLQGLDVFMAGDDVPNKKPDPSIYKIAAGRLQVDPAECLVIEDSTIGLQVLRETFKE